jgi:hypothetical protein
VADLHPASPPPPSVTTSDTTMSSSVFFKFKSQKEPQRVEFDGTGISVFELKRDIIIKSGLGDGTEFDLAIYNEDGNEGIYLDFLDVLLL